MSLKTRSSLVDSIYRLLENAGKLKLEDIYAAFPEHSRPSIRGTIYKNLGKRFVRISKGTYAVNTKATKPTKSRKDGEKKNEPDTTADPSFEIASVKKAWDAEKNFLLVAKMKDNTAKLVLNGREIKVYRYYDKNDPHYQIRPELTDEEIEELLDTFEKGETLKWSFDLTSFGEGKEGRKKFERFLQSMALAKHQRILAYPDIKKKEYSQIHHFYWSTEGRDLELVTACNPITGEFGNKNWGRRKEVGYASYMALRGKPAKVLNAVSRIFELASYVKEAKPLEYEFTGFPCKIVPAVKKERKKVNAKARVKVKAEAEAGAKKARKKKSEKPEKPEKPSNLYAEVLVSAAGNF